jgi:hypothetical protein
MSQILMPAIVVRETEGKGEFIICRIDEPGRT